MVAQACWTQTTPPKWVPGWRWAASRRGACIMKCGGTGQSAPATTAPAWWSSTCSCVTGSGAHLSPACEDCACSELRDHALNTPKANQHSPSNARTLASWYQQRIAHDSWLVQTPGCACSQAILPEARTPRVCGAWRHWRAARVAGQCGGTPAMARGDHRHTICGRPHAGAASDR